MFSEHNSIPSSYENKPGRVDMALKSINQSFSKIQNSCVTVSHTYHVSYRGSPFVVGHTAEHQIHWLWKVAITL